MAKSSKQPQTQQSGVEASPKDNRPDTCSVNSADPDFIYEILGNDFQQDEEVTFTVTGKVVRFESRSSNDYPSSSLEIEISSINGQTALAKDNQSEMQDMEALKGGKSNKQAAANKDNAQDN